MEVLGTVGIAIIGILILIILGRFFSYEYALMAVLLGPIWLVVALVIGIMLQNRNGMRVGKRNLIIT